MARPCVLCGASVGRGDRHAKGGCRVMSRSGRAMRRKRRSRADDAVPQRGIAVAGTGVPKGE